MCMMSACFVCVLSIALSLLSFVFHSLTLITLSLGVSIHLYLSYSFYIPLILPLCQSLYPFCKSKCIHTTFPDAANQHLSPDDTPYSYARKVYKILFFAQLYLFCVCSNRILSYLQLHCIENE